MTEVTLERMLAWVDAAYRVGRWPAQLDGRVEEHRRLYEAVRRAVESSRPAVEVVHPLGDAGEERRD